MPKISKQDARTSELVKIANERTGEILEVISPHDFIIGIDQYMQSDLRVIGSAYITSSLYVKNGASGTLTLPNGEYTLRGGASIQIVDDGDGGFTINSLAPGSIASAPKDAPFLTYQSSPDLSNEKVLNTSGPITFDPLTATVGFDSSASLTVDTLNANSLVIGGSDITSLPYLVSISSPSLPGASVLTAGDGITVATAPGSSTVSVDSSVARLSGAAFTGVVSAPMLNSTTMNASTANTTTLNATDINATKVTSTKLSGSLTKLTDGTSYLIAGTNVTITSGSNGAITIAAPAASGAPLNAKYLLLDASGSGLLSDERLFAVGQGLSGIDGGPGSNYTLKVDDAYVPFLTGAIFSGGVSVPTLLATSFVSASSLTGSLTRLANGSSYLRAGDHVTLSTGSDGSVTISAETGSFMSGPFILHEHNPAFSGSLVLIEGDGIEFTEDEHCGNLTISAKLGAGPGISLTTLPTREIIISSIIGDMMASGSFIMASASDDFPNARLITSSLGLSVLDGGPGNEIDLRVDPLLIPYLTGADFTGDVRFFSGLSGSLTKLSDGSDYLRAGDNISITTGSNGSVTVSSTTSFQNLTGTNGVKVQVNGNSATASADPAIVAFLTGANFTGEVSFQAPVIFNSSSLFVGDATFESPVLFNSGLSGSLTTLVDGSPYLRAGDGIFLTTGTDGSITITNSGPAGDITEIIAGLGLIGGGTSGSITLDVDPTQVAFLTGATFIGPVNFNSGLSGSLTTLVDGSSYIRAGSGISVSTGSGGWITIDASPVTASVTVAGRDRETLWVTGAIPSGTPLEFLTLNFEAVSWDEDLIEIYLNGQLQHSGSQINVESGAYDYYLSGSSSVVFGFDLEGDDTIDGVIQGGDAAPASILDEPFVVFSSASNLTNSRIVTAGAGIDISTGSFGSIVISTNGSGGNSSAFLARLAINDVPSGVIDGLNNTFTLARTPSDTSQIMLWLNGQLLTQGLNYDYQASGNSVTLFGDSIPVEDDTLTSFYPYVEQSSRYILNERVMVATVGTTIQGELANNPQEPSKLMLFWNGQLLSQGVSKDYTIIGKTIYINPTLEVLEDDDIFIACYMAIAENVFYEVNEEITFIYDSGVGLWKGNLSHVPTSTTHVMLFMNGQLLRGGVLEDFVTSGNEIVILDDDVEGDFRFYATYEHT